MDELTSFRKAQTLTWRRRTRFVPGRGDDGNLVTDTGLSMPLDTALPYERRSDELPPRDHGCTPDGVGIAIVDPATLTDAHHAIREWCRRFLHRDDIQFEQ